jgi:metallo-beta-lactamase class B
MLAKWLYFMALALTLRAQDNPDWQRPFEPHRVVGNVYYVGTYDLASFLITTPQGHFLINTGLANSVPLIRSGVEQLGFKFTDIRMLLTTQAHFDHVAGMAEMKRLSGARMLATAGDTPVLEDGGKSDFRFGEDKDTWFAPVKVDQQIKDQQEIKLGGTTLQVHVHPGHTKGSASYSLSIAEGGKTYRVLIANMGTINPGVVLTGNKKYPRIAEDYARTFRLQKALALDVFLSSHASQYRLHQKYNPGDAYDPERFVDPKGYLAQVERLEQTYLEQLRRERAGK